MSAFYLVLLLVAMPVAAADDCFCLVNKKMTEGYFLHGCRIHKQGPNEVYLCRGNDGKPFSFECMLTQPVPTKKVTTCKDKKNKVWTRLADGEDDCKKCGEPDNLDPTGGIRTPDKAQQPVQDSGNDGSQ